MNQGSPWINPAGSRRGATGRKAKHDTCLLNYGQLSVVKQAFCWLLRGVMFCAELDGRFGSAVDGYAPVFGIWDNDETALAAPVFFAVALA